jgi:hypothetical protein
MIKRLTLLLVVAGLLLPLLGCGKKEDASDTSSNSTPATKPTERTEK